MQIVVFGGTGFLGTFLVEALLNEHHAVTVVTRHPPNLLPESGLQYVEWDANSVSAIAPVLQYADAVINLIGESIAPGRWTQPRKDRILSSRIDSTRTIVDALRIGHSRGLVFVNASAVGYYGNTGDAVVTESSPPGSGFLPDVCVAWEREALTAEALGVRVVCLRLATVLGQGGGAMHQMMLPFRLFVGGIPGAGTQWFPWIHEKDVVGIIREILQRKQIRGPINAVAPENVTMQTFCLTLADILRRPCWVPVPALALRLVLGQMADETLLLSQKVLPEAVSRLNYAFEFPSLKPALESVVAQ